MGPKKGEKGKKTGEKSNRPTKTQYNILIAQNNSILAQERLKNASEEENYIKCEENCEKLQEDAADIIKYLNHEIEENEAEAATFASKINNLNKEIKKTDKYYEAIISKMEAAYEEKNMDLQHQIQQINAKLFASEETKQQREEYLRKKEEFAAVIKEMEIRHEKEIYTAEKTAIIKQNTTQSDMETNLAKLAVDFRQASDSAIGETINKLVKDNIALGNKLTCMQETIENGRKTYQKAYIVETNYKYHTELIEREHSMILKKHDSRIISIEAIIKSQEELYERIRSCQKLIKSNRRLQRQIAEEECILREKNEEVKNLMRILNEHENALSIAGNTYNNLRKEVIRLETSIFEAAKRIKDAIEIQNLMHLEDEMETDNKEDQEENLIEHKYKFRETAIDEVIGKLANELANENEPCSGVPSIDSYAAHFNESSLTI